MKTIWKFTLTPHDKAINMPKGAEILTVQTQYGEPRIWALVNPKEETEPRYIKIYGTGHDLPNKPGKYIGTFQVENGSLVFHVFEAQA